MATLALTIAAAALVPATGGASAALLAAGGAAAIGGIIDNMILFPMLFPTPKTYGPRLDGVSVTSANESAPMNFPLGPRNRLGATVIWMSEIEEVEKETGGKGGGGGGAVNYEYYSSIAFSLADVRAQGMSVVEAILADVKDIFLNGEIDGFYDSITIYDGTQTTADPILEAAIGVGKVPAFTGQCYVVIERLYLGEYGNRPPNIESILRQQIEMSAAEAIAIIMQRGGFDPSEYDVSGVGSCIFGYNISGVTTTIDSLGPILATNAISMQDAGNKIVFRDRGSEPVQAVDPDDVSIGVGKSSVGGIERLDQSQQDRYNGAIVDFLADERRLQTGSAPYRDSSISGTDNFLRFSTPLVLDSAMGESVAKRMYYQESEERQSVSFSLPGYYWWLCGADVIDFGEGERFYISSVEHGTDGLIVVEAARTNLTMFDQVGSRTNPSEDPSDPYELPALVYWIADFPAIVDESTDDVVILWGARTADPARNFNGASLHFSASGTTFERVSSIARRGLWGYTLNGPRGEPASETEIDQTSTIVVMSPDYAPTSCTEDEFLNGERNVAAIRTPNGWEIISFRDAVAVGASTYRLSYLLRGLRGTEGSISRHIPSGAELVFLRADPSAFGAWNAGVEAIGSRFIAVVPNGGTVQSSPSRSFSITGESIRPFAVSNMEASRVHVAVDTEDVVIEWNRRTKRIIDPFGSDNAFATDELPEQYLVQIRISGELSPILREEVVTEPRFVYSQAKREADAVTDPSSWTEGDGFRAVVRQISSIVGPGRPNSIYVEDR